MTPEEQKMKSRRAWEEAFDRGNVDALDEIATQGIVFHMPPGPDIRGLAALKQMVMDMRKALSDIQFRVDEIIMEGETEAARWTIQGTHTGQIPNMAPTPPTGKRATMTGIAFIHSVGGKTTEQWEYVDVLGLMRQLGIGPAVSKAA